MSWIHLADHLAAQKLLLQNPQLSGPFNLTAPNPVTNAEFTRELATVLARPALVSVSAVLMKLTLGELAGLLLGGQKVLPERLLNSGFRFLYPDLTSALKEALVPRRP
jgi:NAD dependent epimerase/dehydratase family enzyme